MYLQYLIFNATPADVSHFLFIDPPGIFYSFYDVSITARCLDTEILLPLRSNFSVSSPNLYDSRLGVCVLEHSIP